MKAVITRGDVKQLRKLGYDYRAGQIVDADELPDWMRRRMEEARQPLPAKAEERLRRQHEADIAWAREMNAAMAPTAARWKALEKACGRDAR